MADFRRNVDDIIDYVACYGEPVVVTVRGKPKYAIVPPSMVNVVGVER